MLKAYRGHLQELAEFTSEIILRSLQEQRISHRTTGMILQKYKLILYITHYDILYPDHKITSLVGHGLAGSVVLEIQKQYLDRNFKKTTYVAPAACMTAPDRVNNKRCRNYDGPVSTLDRGSTMSVKDPMTLQNDLNIKSPSNIAEMVTKALN